MSPKTSTKKAPTTCVRSVLSKNSRVSVASSFADAHKKYLSPLLLLCMQQADHAGVGRLLEDPSQSLGFFDVALAWLFIYEQSPDDVVDIMDHYLQTYVQKASLSGVKDALMHQKGYQQRSLIATFFIESTPNMLDRFAQRLPSLTRLHCALVFESIMAENALQKSVPRSLFSLCVYRKSDAILQVLRSIIPRYLDVVGPDGYTLVVRSVVHHDDVFVHWAMDDLPPYVWFATQPTGHSAFSLAFLHGNVECVSLLMHHYGEHEALQQAVVGDGRTITPALAAFFSCTDVYFTAQLSQSLCTMLLLHGAMSEEMQSHWKKMVLRYLSSAKLKRSDEHWQNYVSLLHVLSHISCSLQPISLSGMNDATLSRHNLIRLLFQQESSYSPDLLRDAWTTNDRQPPQKIPFALACVHFSSLGKMLLDAMQYEYQQHVSFWSVVAWDYAYILANDTRVIAGLMGLCLSVASLKYALPHHESVWMWLLAYTSSPQTLSVGEARGFFWRGWQESLLPSDQAEGSGISEVTAVRIGRAFKALERLQPTEFEHGVSVFQSVWRMNMSVAVVMQAAHQLTTDQHYQHVLLRYTLRHNALWQAIHTNRIQDNVDRTLFANKLVKVLENALQAADSHTLACVWMYVQRIEKDQVRHRFDYISILEGLKPIMKNITRHIQSLACMPAFDDDALNFNDAPSDAILTNYGFQGDTYHSAKCFFEKISLGIDKSCKTLMKEKKVLEDENIDLKAKLHAAELSLQLLQEEQGSGKRKGRKKPLSSLSSPRNTPDTAHMVMQNEIQQLEASCVTINKTHSVSPMQPAHHTERADKTHASTQTAPRSTMIDSKGVQVAGNALSRSLRRFTDATTQSVSSLHASEEMAVQTDDNRPQCIDACTESTTSITQTVSTQTVDQQHLNGVAPACDGAFEKKDSYNDAAHVVGRMQARIKQLEKETQRGAKRLYVLTMARLGAESDAYQLACEAHTQQTVLRQELACLERTMATGDAASTRSYSNASASTFSSSTSDLSVFATGVCVEPKHASTTMEPQSEPGKEHVLWLPPLCASHHQDDANVKAPIVANVQDVPAEHALGASTHSVFNSDGFVTVGRKKNQKK